MALILYMQILIYIHKFYHSCFLRKSREQNRIQEKSYNRFLNLIFKQKKIYSAFLLLISYIELSLIDNLFVSNQELTNFICTCKIFHLA